MLNQTTRVPIMVTKLGGFHEADTIREWFKCPLISIQMLTKSDQPWRDALTKATQYRAITGYFKTKLTPDADCTAGERKC